MAASSWKTQGTAPAARASVPAWKHAAAPARPRRSRRLYYLAGSGLAFFGACAFLIWIATWLRPQKAVNFLLIGATYEDNLAFPPNALGKRSLQGIADFATGLQNNLIDLVGGGVQEFRSDRDWGKTVADMKGQALIIYISAHGGVDEKGPYLLPTDADFRDIEAYRRRLKDLLDRIKFKHERLPAVQTVLVLEATGMPAHPSLGIVNNDFARAVQGFEAQIAAVPNLVVLVASSPDERAWNNDAWRQTAFGRFFLEGLRGGADVNEDRRVTLWELHQYLGDKVTTWSRLHRGGYQTPLLLPRGPAGEHRARSIRLALTEPNYVPREAPEISWDGAEQAQAAWKAWAVLDDQIPHPATHDPHLWQQYQGGVLRYEYYLRIGESAAAELWRQKLKAWEDELNQASQIPLRCVETSLVLPAALHRVSNPDPAVGRNFKELWEAPSLEEAKKSWAGWVKEAAAKKTPLARSVYVSLVLERAKEDPERNLQRAAGLLRFIRDVDIPLPVEGHNLLLLQRDLASNPPQAEFNELIQADLNVRSLAEAAALSVSAKEGSYCEMIFPWIQSALMEADTSRRLGQDLLVSAQAKDWQKARELFKKARDTYESIQADAASLRRAFATRDRLTARLPWFTQWLLEHPWHLRRTESKPLEPLQELVLNLWNDLHLLRRDLETPRPLAETKLKGQAETLSEGFKKLEASFEDHLQTLQALSTAIPEDALAVYLETEAALKVPQKDLPRRLELLSWQHQLLRRLDTEPPRKVDLVSAEEVARKQAQREGRFANAFLGPRWIEQFAGPEDFNFVQIQHRLEIFVVEEGWRDSIRKTGNQFGATYRAMFAEMTHLNAPDSKVDAATFVQGLQRGDAMVRSMGTDVTLPAKLDPAAAYFRAQVSGLLNGLALRTLEEHWFEDEPQAEPYYRVVGRLFAGDGKALLASLTPSPKVQASWAEFEKKLRLPGELALQDVTDRTPEGKLTEGFLKSSLATVTSEQKVRRKFRLTPSRKEDYVPAGYPVLWCEPAAALETIEPAPKQRVPIAFSPVEGGPETTFDCSMASKLVASVEEKPLPFPKAERTPLKVTGRFRGQILKLDTPLETQPQPEWTLRSYRLPEKASVAVRTRREITTKFGSAQGAIAFLLDASGSMGAPPGTDPRDSRYAQGLAALRRVLQKLPRDTQVSVWTFGQAVGPGKTVDPAEKSIQQVLPLTRWDPDNPKQLASLMARLAYPGPIEPWNQSPLARSLLAVRDELSKFPGFKTLVCISDAGDNRFENDLALKDRYGTIAKMLRTEFGGGEIVLHVVGFPPPNAKLEAATRKEFEVIQNFEPPGKLYYAQDAVQLAETIESMLKQRVQYWVDRQGRNVTVNEVPETGLDVSAAGSNYRWVGKGLPPGGHKVRVEIEGRVEKNVLLHRGDLLLVDLVDTPQGLTFERYLFSNDFPWKRPKENELKDWRLTVLQNQKINPVGLQMLLSLEKTAERRETVLEQIKPKDVWFEVAPPPEVQTPFAGRVGALVGYPAPAWTVDVSAWPTFLGSDELCRPVVKAWWNPDEYVAHSGTIDVPAMINQPARSVEVRGEKSVVIESVLLENHRVEVKLGQWSLRPCLVVRMRHAPDRPVLARLHGLEASGHEHRLYTRVGKTTSIFWFDDEPKLNAEARLRLFSASTFKEEALQRGFFASINDLGVPDLEDFRPRPPLELK